MRVLFVEDDALDADLTRRALAEQAPHIALHRVDTLAGAQACLQDPAALPDLLLADMKLPDGNGLELLRVVRDAGLPLPVVMLTGSGDEATVVAALRGGADDYVVKSHDYLARLALRLDEVRARFRQSAARHARPIQVLYAERTATDIDLLRRHLNRYAPHLVLDTVGSAAEVLARLDPEPAPGQPWPDVLLLDFQLPGMNALELVKLLRQERGLDLPIVVVTGQGDEDSAVQTLKLGATDYLVKQGDLFHRLPVTLESAHLRVQLERERAALSESKARFQQMAEAIGDIFFLTNWSASRVLYVSPAYERLWREPVERLYEDGQSWFKPMHPEDRQRIQAQIPTTLGADFDAEFRVVLGDEVRHMHMRSRQVWTPRASRSGAPASCRTSASARCRRRASSAWPITTRSPACPTARC